MNITVHDPNHNRKLKFEKVDNAMAVAMLRRKLSHISVSTRPKGNSKNPRRAVLVCITF